MVAPVILSVVAFVAGHPTGVVCDADVNPSPKPAPPGYVVDAWTPLGTGPIHLAPSVCAKTDAPVGSPQFAYGIGAVIREASIAGPVRSEACASLIQSIGVYDVLRRFYNVPFFSQTSVRIGGEVLSNVRAGPPGDYQPEACRWPG